MFWLENIIEVIVCEAGNIFGQEKDVSNNFYGPKKVEYIVKVILISIQHNIIHTQLLAMYANTH